MPAQTTTEMRSGITGAVYTAPVGTTDPSNTSAAWPAGWTDVGLLTKDGAPEITPSADHVDFDVWQGIFPGRTNKTKQGMEYKFTVAQKNGSNLKLTFGGGTITSLGGGDYRYDPPLPRDIDYRAFGIEVQDGTLVDRWVMERGLVVAVASIPFKTDQLVKFDLTVRALGAPGATTSPWRLISNDPAMAS